MAARSPQRRTVELSARELAEKHGVSERSVRNLQAEPRAEFEARARKRQMRAVELRNQGMTYGEIAKALNVSRGAAVGLVRRGLEAPVSA